MWIDLENTEENSDKIGKIWEKKVKISWIVKDIENMEER